tara:strand:- start:5213 stop:5638 length:426 start_codon:yes stop_codon:yes gene_type:complete
MPYKDPVKRKQEKKEWYEKNKERIKTESKRKYKSLSYKEKKLRSFKNQGFKGDLEEVFEKYDNIDNCEVCSVKLIVGSRTGPDKKCADHNHITGYYRHTLCGKCNFYRQYIDRDFLSVIRELKTIQNPKPVFVKFIKKKIF